MDNANLVEVQRLLANGISLLPIRTDGSKAPYVTEWEHLQRERVAPDRAGNVFAGNVGWGVICGHVSGDLEVLDFDKEGVFALWRVEVDKVFPGLVDSLPLVDTPSGGQHLYYRCDEIDGSLKLARAREKFRDRTGKEKLALIETKGRGGYVLAPGCPKECHEAHETYTQVSGPPIDETPRITPQQRKWMHEVARSFHEPEDKQVHRPPGTASVRAGRPGDDYGERTGWAEILQPHGWELERNRGDVCLWRRPGKRHGVSATTGHCGDLLYVFSTNASPFDSERAYGKFSAYALLNHGGDFTAAAKELREMGYGEEISQQPADQSAPDDDWEDPVDLDEQSELPPFPVDALPVFIRDFVLAEAEATQTPPDLAATLCLAAMALALQGRFEADAGGGWVEPLNLYTAVVLGPGNRKSAVFRDAMAPIREYEKRQAERLQPVIRQAEIEKGVLQEQLEKAKKAAANGKPGAKAQAIDLAEQLAELREHVVPELTADDVTPEKLGALMQAQGGKMAIISAEGGGPFAMMGGKYSGKPSLEIFLRSHAGDAHRVHRIKRESEYIERPALTIGVTMQPSVLASLDATEGFRGSGLLARFLYSVPKSLVGKRKIRPQPVPDHVMSDYCMGITAMLDGPRNAEPIAIRMDNAARHELEKFQSELEALIAPGAELASMADWVSKAPGAALRLAAICECCECSVLKGSFYSLLLSVKHTTKAIEIVRYFLEHAKYAFSEMKTDSTLWTARQVLERVRARELRETTERDLHQMLRGMFPKVSDMTEVLETLLERGYCRRLISEEKKPGRPKSPRLQFHPAIWGRKRRTP